MLLIAEIDTPRIYLAADEQELKAGMLLLRGLLALVKSHSGQFRSVFFASAMHLHDLDWDVADNSFIDVSDDMVLAAGCGFTRVELKHYFAEHLRSARECSAEEAVSDAKVEALLDVLETCCGIYAFDKQHIQVFAPDAVLRFLADEVACS